MKGFKKSVVKILLGIGLVITTQSFAFTPNELQKSKFYNLVEKSLYFDNTLMTYLMGWTNDSNQIKNYNPYLKPYHQCLIDNFSNPENYQSELEKEMDDYFSSINQEQFEDDLAILQELETAGVFAKYQDFSKQMANKDLIGSDVYGVLTGHLPFVDDDNGDIAEDGDVDLDKLFSKIYDDKKYYPLQKLLGMEEVESYSFHHKIRDNCHRSYWRYRQAIIK